MATNRNDSIPIVIRILSALGGFIGGGIIGTILLILTMVITGMDFSLNSIWPVTITSAILGTILGFFFPKIGKTLADILHYFP